jgi:hypothetical protein
LKISVMNIENCGEIACRYCPLLLILFLDLFDSQ